MKRPAKHAAELFSDLRQLTYGEISLSWLALCVLMTKFCAVISVGLLLFFTIGIVAGFGHEITIPKLLGGIFILVVWPIGMGFMIGTTFFLRERWRRVIHRLFEQKNQPNKSRLSNRP